MTVLNIADYLSLGQAARALGCSENYVRQLCVSGRLVYLQTALGRLIDPDSLREVATRRRKGVSARQ